MCNKNKPWYILNKRWKLEQDHLLGKISEIGVKNKVNYDYLYERLNIIDSKIGALLNVNSILLVAAGMLSKNQSESIDIYSTSVILWAVSTFICLLISLFKWEYLDSTATNNTYYLDKIISVTVIRTLLYNISVLLIIASIISFASVF